MKDRKKERNIRMDKRKDRTIKRKKERNIRINERKKKSEWKKEASTQERKIDL